LTTWHRWNPARETLVFVGTVAIGPTLYELTEHVDVRYVNGKYARLAASGLSAATWRYQCRPRILLDREGVPSMTLDLPILNYAVSGYSLSNSASPCRIARSGSRRAHTASLKPASHAFFSASSASGLRLSMQNVHAAL